MTGLQAYRAVHRGNQVERYDQCVRSDAWGAADISTLPAGINRALSKSSGRW